MNTIRDTRLAAKPPRTQCSVASAAGISPQHLNRIEKGTTIPRIDVAQRIALVLGVNLDVLWPMNLMDMEGGGV